LRLKFLRPMSAKMNVFSKLKNTKILLIDDDEWIRDAMTLFFEAEGCQITALETAEEALVEFHRQNYGIVICDYKLPGIDGLQLLKEIEKTKPGTKMMLITAYKTDALVAEAKQIGIHDFISKPFTSETIEASLSRLTAEF
jgi:DNA-binding NtrC family response regulator